jgi:uncharacterized membrane protein
MSWVDAEYVLVTIAAMLSPLTLTWSVLALVLSRQPLRTGLWFYVGALVATLAVGVAAVFVLGDAAASHSPSTPKAWVAVVDVVAGLLLVVWAVRLLRRPLAPEKEKSMVERMSGVASSPAIAIFAAGAVLANPGVFIPLALKTISELDPSRAQYYVEWTVFALVSLLPLVAAIVMLVVARDWAARVLGGARGWLERNASAIAATIVFVLAASLLRGGIAGLAS